MDRIDADISRYQAEGASDKSIEENYVMICHSISSDVDCLLEVAQKSNNRDACDEITNSHEKFESTEEENLEYLEGVREFCLHRVT